ncbi:MAG: LysM domain-containing protein [Porticoccaceae bacterium]
MKKILAALAGFALWAGAAFADDVFRDGAPQRYTVQKGDTLWGISAMFLSDPWKWPEIWSANPQIENPHLIYPGDIVALTYVDGVPRLTLERDGVTASSGASSVAAPTTGRTVKLVPQIREISHEEAIPAIPLDTVNSFLVRTRVVQPGELEAAPYVLAGHERRIISGRGDDFYVRGPLLPDVNFYGIYRRGDSYVDRETQEVLGIKAQDIGSGQLKVTEGDVSTFLTVRSEQEIRVGDRLLPHEERRLDPNFFPRPPEQQLAGRIIDVEGGVSQVGTLNVVAINRGEREGLRTGDLLAIHKQGETVRDRVTGQFVKLPSERAGLLMVFRTFEKMSFGLVLNANRPLAVNDEVRSP